MGSALGLSIHAPGPSADEGATLARLAWRAVVAEFASSDAAMSRFRDDSEITLLNRLAGTAMPRRVSVRLRRALVAADRARRATAGRFDARVLVALDRLGYMGVDVSGVGSPTATAPPVTVDADGVRLAGPVDLGGIGKGLALRWSAEHIRALDPEASFLLEAGGDIVTKGTAPEGGPWTIGIEDPAERGGPLAAIALSDAAVATSSIRVNRWRAGDRVAHHLIDPETGEPADGGLLAVTVVDRDPAWAEVWSKALFIVGRHDIAEVARERGIPAWWVRDDGGLEMTPAARQHTVWIAGEP